MPFEAERGLRIVPKQCAARKLAVDGHAGVWFYHGHQEAKDHVEAALVDIDIMLE